MKLIIISSKTFWGTDLKKNLLRLKLFKKKNARKKKKKKKYF